MNITYKALPSQYVPFHRLKGRGTLSVTRFNQLSYATFFPIYANAESVRGFHFRDALQ